MAWYSGLGSGYGMVGREELEFCKILVRAFVGCSSPRFCLTDDVAGFGYDCIGKELVVIALDSSRGCINILRR